MLFSMLEMYTFSNGWKKMWLSCYLKTYHKYIIFRLALVYLSPLSAHFYLPNYWDRKVRTVMRKLTGEISGTRKVSVNLNT